MPLSDTDFRKLRRAETTARQLRKRRNTERKAQRPANPKADRGRIRDREYLAWLRRQPCAVGPEGCSGPTEAAHVRFARPGQPMTGMQRKPHDREAVPLCSGHHREGPESQHSRGERRWWAARGIDPHALADAYYARFKRGK